LKGSDWRGAAASCHPERSEGSAKEKLIDSAQWIELTRGIGQVIVWQIPPRALRALVGMTPAAIVSKLDITP